VFQKIFNVIFMPYNYALTNPLCAFLNKPREDFTREDLLKVIEEKQIERITFHYTAIDGKLKELKIPVPARINAEIVLTEGERADGSSLFKGLIDTGLSDLYIVPVFKSAFINPFYPGSLDFVCRYLTATGEPAPFAPDNILGNARRLLKKNTGLDLFALGELEFYLFYENESKMYLPYRQKAYHISAPFSKTGIVLAEMLKNLTQIVGAVKYAHNEVGYINSIKSGHEELNGKTGEQLEIELLGTPIDEAADNIVLAKWLIRNIAYKHGMLATFAPKIEDGNAGNGMHIHMKLFKDGRNVMVDENGTLTEYAKRLIGGLCRYSNTLTAFGNTCSSSYLRLVPNQEAPTRICWSDSNRSSMIRVPLGWSKTKNLASFVNPGINFSPLDIASMQTVEIRTPDGSANTHLLLAGLTLAADWGLTNDKSLTLAEKLYVKGNIFKDKKLLEGLAILPSTCSASADILQLKRSEYERENIFTPSIIDYTIESLKAEKDTNLHKNLAKLKGGTRKKFIDKLVEKDLHKN
jgi:glutamine synthetase